MNTPAKILVVDDTPKNVKLLADLLTVKAEQEKFRTEQFKKGNF